MGTLMALSICYHPIVSRYADSIRVGQVAPTRQTRAAVVTVQG